MERVIEGGRETGVTELSLIHLPRGERSLSFIRNLTGEVGLTNYTISADSSSYKLSPVCPIYSHLCWPRGHEPISLVELVVNWDQVWETCEKVVRASLQFQSGRRAAADDAKRKGENGAAGFEEWKEKLAKGCGKFLIMR